MFDYNTDRHNNCPYFKQNAWMRGENKYICAKYDEDKLLFVDMEIPEGCVKGFHPFHFYEPKEKPKKYGNLRVVR